MSLWQKGPFSVSSYSERRVKAFDDLPTNMERAGNGVWGTACGERRVNPLDLIVPSFLNPGDRIWEQHLMKGARNAVERC